MLPVLPVRIPTITHSFHTEFGQQLVLWSRVPRQGISRAQHSPEMWDQESECARTDTPCVPHVQNWAGLPIPLSQTELLFPHSLAEAVDSLNPRGLLKASMSPSSQVG